MRIKFFLRCLIIFIFPLIIVFFLCYSLSLNINFDIGSRAVDPNTLKQFILETLDKQEQKFELLTPVIDPRWFLYRVNLKNNMKIAIEATEPPYSEHETTLILETNRNIEIPYGKEVNLAFNLRRNDILAEFKGYRFDIKPSHQVVKAGPNQIVKFEHSPLLGATEMKIKLSFWSIFFIYILSLIFFRWNNYFSQTTFSICLLWEKMVVNE